MTETVRMDYTRADGSKGSAAMKRNAAGSYETVESIPDGATITGIVWDYGDSVVLTSAEFVKATSLPKDAGGA